MLNTTAEIGYLNALNECPIVWVASENTYELINEITGEIFISPNISTLKKIRANEIELIKSLPYPGIPYNVKIGN